MNRIKERILEEQKKGNVVFATSDGLNMCSLETFIKQPVDGMLYDLNRLESVVLTFIDDPKWINDYAVSQVIRALKYRIAELELKLTYIQ